MTKKGIEQLITELVQPITDMHSFELVDVEFVKEGANWYLRIYIDKPEGINIDDCQVISEELSEKLDKTDPIEQSYFLEVSSPGLERPLKTERDFEKYSNEAVEVKLFQPLDGQKVFEGQLQGLKDNKILIKMESGNVIEFDREKVALIKRVIKF